MTYSGMRSALLRVGLLAFVPIATFAQTEPVIVQAEDPAAMRGTTMAIGTDATGTTYVTTTLNDTNPPSATTASQKVAQLHGHLPGTG